MLATQGQLAAIMAANRAPRPLEVIGMHGRGDCLHTRGLLKQWIEDGREVWLESSWISLFHDLIATGKLHVVHKVTNLRTQTKNARREAGLFDKTRPPMSSTRLRISYSPAQVRRLGSVMAAMCETVRCDYSRADFRLPVPQPWRDRAQALIDEWKPAKPIMIFRPPCERPEWGGHKARNPDPEAYAQLFESIHDRYFVVSIADLEPGKEWLVGRPLAADIKLHSGELDFETMAGLFSKAKLVFTTGGFAVIMAQAVETPVIAIMGGYEDHRSYLGGARFSRYLGIDPIKPCQCFSHDHKCQKAIDIPSAQKRIEDFIA